ncbi:aldo/keto reductase [bacterium]|nr:aldo/keto reductase [bacterium]
MRKQLIDRRRFIQSTLLSAAGLGLVHSGRLLPLLPDAIGAEFPVPRRYLGKTGVQIPILQLGTSQSLDPVYDKILHRCYNGGVTALDTALSYGWGSSHRAIANFIQQSGDRKKLWITSKSGAWNADGLIKDVDKCLDQLQTDYLDLFLMHGINNTDYLNRDSIQAGETLKRSGKIRFFGFSNHSGDIAALMQQAVKSGGIDAILFRYNFRTIGESRLNKAVDDCKNAGIGLIAMKTMGGVSDKEERVVKFQSQRFSLAQAKLKTVWEDDRIDAIVSEMQSVQEVRENIAAAKSSIALTAREKQLLNELAGKTGHLACLGCSYLCEQAVVGDIAITDTLRFLMYDECYGKTELARQLFQNLPASKRYFGETDLSAAMQVCPQRINIEERLVMASTKLSV